MYKINGLIRIRTKSTDDFFKIALTNGFYDFFFIKLYGKIWYLKFSHPKTNKNNVLRHYDCSTVLNNFFFLRNKCYCFCQIDPGHPVAPNGKKTNITVQQIHSSFRIESKNTRLVPRRLIQNKGHCAWWNSYSTQLRPCIPKNKWSALREKYSLIRLSWTRVTNHPPTTEPKYV